MTQKGLTAEKVHAALELSNGSVTEAARLLGVSRQTIYEWKRRRRIVVDRVVRPLDAA